MPNWSKIRTLSVLTLCLSLTHSAIAGNTYGIAVKTQTTDGVTIHGQKHFADLGPKTPLILLFHQGGANGSGEYADLIPWLNKSGYRTMVWDQRAGGNYFGGENKTVKGLNKKTKAAYCDAYPDLQAALQYSMDNKLADKVIIWGSSYSAALVVQLAAKNPDNVAAVLSFSPASGGPMVKCRARQWLDNLKAPLLVLRPESEMARDSSIEQKRVLIAASANFEVIKNGVHGSSMLVDERTKHDMKQPRKKVTDWLKTALATQ